MAESTGVSFHFLSDWQSCPRRFYFGRVCRLAKPAGTGATMGSALHEALAAHRSGGDARKVLWDFFESAVADREERREQYGRASGWLNSWLTRLAPLEAHLQVDPELPLQMNAGFALLTGRIDALLHDDELTVEDLKSSSFKGEDRIVADEMASDQYAMYAFLVRSTYGVNPRIRINVAYLKPALPTAALSDPFYVPVEAQEDYLAGARRIYGDIVETLEAYADGQPLAACWPRATGFCTAFGCPYMDICRRPPDLREGVDSPAGFGLTQDMRIAGINARIGGLHWTNEEP